MDAAPQAAPTDSDLKYRSVGAGPLGHSGSRKWADVMEFWVGGGADLSDSLVPTDLDLGATAPPAGGVERFALMVALNWFHHPAVRSWFDTLHPGGGGGGSRAAGSAGGCFCGNPYPDCTAPPRRFKLHAGFSKMFLGVVALLRWISGLEVKGGGRRGPHTCGVWWCDVGSTGASHTFTLLLISCCLSSRKLWLAAGSSSVTAL